MKFVNILVFGFYIFCLSFNVNGVQFTGKAFDMSSGKLLYQEHHKVTLGKENQYQETQVLYTDATGAEFARKQLDFSHALLVPSVYFVDTRSDVTLKIEHDDQNIKVVYQDSRDS
ncbi:MAG: hypothetical protein HWE39_25605, partial [Oceanospirillaceae bacterium]|nr:hypothetical protein [Oceanospirillaceae bacterium]